MATTTIYVVSTQRFSGKTALCAGLLNWFRSQGFAVGYMKPVSTAARIIHEQLIEEDVQFIKEIFTLGDSPEKMAPLFLNEQQVERVVSGEMQDFKARLLEAFHGLAAERDVLIFEGGASLREGSMIDLSPPRLSEFLGTHELVVVPYVDGLQVIDDLLTCRAQLGKSMLGGVINSVPKHRLDYIQKKMKPFIERLEVPIFAVLPKEQLLTSVSISELRDGLGGEVLCAHQAVNELVEHLMVGAMSVDSALTYFRRQANKAVITGGDRADLQLAALETSTRCLILTGDLRPSPFIIGRAEERGVPIILTRHDTLTAIELIENFFGKTRFHQAKKVEYFENLLVKYFDFAAFSDAVNTATKLGS